MVLQYSPGFYPFSDTRSNPTFPILAWILPFQHLLEFYPFRYLLGFHIFGTRLDSTLFRYSPGPFSGTRPDSTFSTLARILPFPDTHSDPSPVLTKIPPFRHLPGFHLFGTSPDSNLSSTCPYSTFSVPVRIPHFRYFPRFHIFGTHPDSTLSRYSPFTRIPHFQYSPTWIFPFSNTCPDFYFFGIRLNSTLFRHSP